MTQREYAKSRKDCIIFKGINFIKKMLEHVLEFKGEAKKLITKLLNIIYFW